MKILPRFALRFTPSVLMSIFAFSFIILFVKLGVWQYNRAIEKQQLLDNYAQSFQSKPQLWNRQQPAPYAHIRLRGHYLPITLFLDNQQQQHLVGYDVLTPYLLDQGEIVLVDRGFVVGDVAHHKPPVLAQLDETMEIVGHVYYPSSKQWTLGPAVEKLAQNIVLIERVDFAEINLVLHKSVVPFIMRLDTKVKHGFMRNWPIVAMSPQRHYGYTVQWFALALVVLISYIYFIRQR